MAVVAGAMVASAALMGASLPQPAEIRIATPVPAAAQQFDGCVRQSTPTQETMRTWSAARVATTFFEVAASCLKSAGIPFRLTDPRVFELGDCLRRAAEVPEQGGSPITCLNQVGLLPSPPPATEAQTTAPSTTAPPTVQPTTAPLATERPSSPPPTSAPPAEASTSFASPTTKAPRRTLPPTIVPHTSLPSVLPLPSHEPPQSGMIPANTAYLAAGTAFVGGVLLGASIALRSLARRAQRRRRGSAKVEVDLQEKGS